MSHTVPMDTPTTKGRAEEEKPVRKLGFKLLKIGMMALTLTIVAGATMAAMPLVKSWLKSNATRETAFESGHVARVRLVDRESIEVPAEIQEALGMQVVEAQKASQPRELPPFTGSLNFENGRFSRVRARFGGEIVEVGTTSDREEIGGATGRTVVRPLRNGDRVEKGQLLAVVRSKDLGEKKSDLIDALSQLKLNDDNLKSLKAADTKGVTPERTIRDADRQFQLSVIAVRKAENTLRSWGLTDAEIDTVKAEAKHIIELNGKNDQENQSNWARVEIRAPIDGTILEMNLNMVGDIIVDNTIDLFKIVDLSVLGVWAHAYEGDLPILQSLPRPLHWQIRLKEDPRAKPLPGVVDKIGEVIDPTQHTAFVVGRVNNSEGLLRVGQAVTATVSVPPASDEVEIPTTALVEDGRDSVVFVQEDPHKPTFRLRRVAVVRRLKDVVYIRSRVSVVDRTGIQALLPGDRVVCSSAVQLRNALEDLQTAPKQ